MKNLINAHLGNKHFSFVFCSIFSFSLSLSICFLRSISNLWRHNQTQSIYSVVEQTKLIELLGYFYVESEFPALHLTEFVMRSNVRTKTAKNVEMFQYIDVNDTGGGYNKHNSKHFFRTPVWNTTFASFSEHNFHYYFAAYFSVCYSFAFSLSALETKMILIFS